MTKDRTGNDMADDFKADARAAVNVNMVIEATVNMTASMTMKVSIQDLGLLLAAGIVTEIGKGSRGALVEWIAPVYETLLLELEREPNLRFRIPWRKFEEVIAASYRRRGFTDVILTPHSNDFGVDVIATKNSSGVRNQLRILESVKRYSPGQLVTADDVRALMGVVLADRQDTGEATRGIVTTTAEFAPRVGQDLYLKPRLDDGTIELVGGDQLLTRLKELLP